MDECEVLCTRLAIMKNGKFKCLGGVQDLKTRLGQGFKVCIKLPKESDVDKKEKTYDNVTQFMEKNFKDCRIEDEHEGMLEYSVPYSSTSWSKLFQLMEQAKQTHRLDDYSVSQANLEQVFLSIADK